MGVGVGWIMIAFSDNRRQSTPHSSGTLSTRAFRRRQWWVVCRALAHFAHCAGARTIPRATAPWPTCMEPPTRDLGHSRVPPPFPEPGTSLEGPSPFLVFVSPGTREIACTREFVPIGTFAQLATSLTWPGIVSRLRRTRSTKGTYRTHGRRGQGIRDKDRA